MASFTDQISNFNPYVSQLPVEAMAQVGMQKQAQYDAGVQKIQGYVDNIAGIKTLRPQDEQYVQSKLNELGGKLKTVAAGDFSNQQLVNSVGGMATNVVKDPIIQAAVYSYSNDSKNLEEMEADRKKGELTPQAENYYKDKRNAYMNNQSLTDEQGKPITFSGKYIKSWDLDGNLIKAIDAVGDSEFTAQNVFKTVNGVIQHKYEPIIDPKTKQPVIDKSTGKPAMRDLGPELADAAVEAMKKGKFSKNVQAAIDSVFMRPEAQQELAMRGVYEYRGYDNIGDFVNQYDKEKEKGKALLEDRKISLMASIASEQDPEKKKQLQNMLTSIDSEMTALSSAVDAKINQAKEFKSVDNYKAALYQQRMRNLYMTSGVTETESRKYVKNEVLASQREAIEKERTWVKSKHDMKIADFNATTSRLNTTLEYDKWADDPLNSKNPNSPLNPNYKPRTLEGGAEPEDYFVNFVNKGIETENAYNTTKEKFVVDWLKTITSINGKSVSDAQVRADLDKWQKGDPNFLNRKFEEAKQNVRENATNSRYANLVSSLPNVDGSEKALQNYYDQSAQLDKELKDKGIVAPDISKLLKPMEVTYTSRGTGLIGSFVTQTNTTKLSAKDMYNLAFIKSNSGTPDQKEKVSAELVKRFNLPIEEIKTTFLSYLTPASKMLGAEAPITPEFVKALNEASLLLTSSTQNALVKAKGELIKDKGIGNSPVSFGLHEPGDKPETKNITVQNLKLVLNKYGVADEDVDEFITAYSGPEGEQSKSNVQFDISRGGSGGGENKVNLSVYTAGSLKKSVQITKDDMDFIKQFTTKIPAGKSAVVERVSFYKENSGTNSQTSDPNDPDAYKGAFYKSSDFFKLKRKDVMGADVIVNNMGQPTAWFYINTKNGVIGVPFKQETDDILPRPFPSIDAAETFILGIDNSGTFDKILKTANIK